MKNENKKIVRNILIALMAIAVIASFASAQVTTTPQDALSTVNLTISPQPVIAGDNITISFLLFNSYTSNLNDVNLEITSASPLISVSPSYSFIVDGIGTGVYGGVSNRLFTYNVHIPSTLPEGEYTLYIMAYYTTVQSNGETNYDVAAQSQIPIYIYVYGNPDVELNGIPSTSIVPGHDFSIAISAVNTGDGAARNVSLSILNSSVFSADGANRFNLGIIQSGSEGSTTAQIFASQNISSGINYLPVKVSYTSDANVSTTEIENISLNVLLNQPNIAASIINSVPTELNPGGNQTVTVLLQNIGTGQANNVSVQFLNGTGISASGTASYFFIGTLAQSASVQENVFISANKNANQSNYTLPVRIKYTHANYKGNVTQMEYIPIKVQSGAIFNVTAASSSLLPGSTYKPLTFVVKNIGNEEAQQISFSLQSLYPITPVTPVSYITSLAPGQSTNVTFYVSVVSTGNPGTYPVTLYEQWRQPNGATNQQYSGSNNYYAEVVNSSGSNTYEYAVAAVVVVVIVVLVLRRRMKGMKKKAKA